MNSGITSTTVLVEGAYDLVRTAKPRNCLNAQGIPQRFYWPAAENASMSLVYPLFDEIRARSSSYIVVSNVTDYYPTLTAAIVENVSPSVEAISFYGASTEFASRLVPQSMLEDSQSIQTVAEAIWQGLQIATAPLQDHPAGVFAFQGGVALFGNMPTATKDRVNETGANPGFYNAAWHVVYDG